MTQTLRIPSHPQPFAQVLFFRVALWVRYPICPISLPWLVEQRHACALLSVRRQQHSELWWGNSALPHTSPPHPKQPPPCHPRARWRMCLFSSGVLSAFQTRWGLNNAFASLGKYIYLGSLPLRSFLCFLHHLCQVFHRAVSIRTQITPKHLMQESMVKASRKWTVCNFLALTLTQTKGLSGPLSKL